MDAEHAPKERLVSPSLWPSLSVHVVASPASQAALEVGGLSVHSFQPSTLDRLCSRLDNFCRIHAERRP